MQNTALNDLFKVLLVGQQVKSLKSIWLNRTGLSSNDLLVLFYIHRHPRVEIAEIADAYSVSKTTLTANIGRLINKKLLDTIVKPQDRCHRYLVLSANGHTKLKEVVAIMRQTLSREDAELLLTTICQLNVRADHNI